MRQLLDRLDHITAILTTLPPIGTYACGCNGTPSTTQSPATQSNTTTAKKDGAEVQVQRFIVSTLFLRECLRQLTQGPDESLVFLTGHQINGKRIVDQMIPVDLVQQTRTYAKACDISLTKELETMRERGFTLLGTAHSHPGCGIGATLPSSIDMSHHERLELMGYHALGIIVTRDGHVRFYSDQMPFEVEVIGKDVVKHNQNSYRLLLEFRPNEDEKKDKVKSDDAGLESGD